MEDEFDRLRAEKHFSSRTAPKSARRGHSTGFAKNRNLRDQNDTIEMA
jgi:hypothetical protein